MSTYEIDSTEYIPRPGSPWPLDPDETAAVTEKTTESITSKD